MVYEVESNINEGDYVDISNDGCIVPLASGGRNGVQHQKHKTA